MLTLSKDAKTWVHVALIVAAAVVAGISIRPFTTLAVLQITAGAITSIVVYIGTNADTGFWKYLKFYLAAGGAAVTAVGTYVVGSAGLTTVTPSDWLTVVFVALGALGVIAVGETQQTLDPGAVITVNHVASPAEPSITAAEVVPTEAVASVSETQLADVDGSLIPSPAATVVTSEPIAPPAPVVAGSYVNAAGVTVLIDANGQPVG